VRTVYRWLDRETCPAHQPQPKRLIDKQERLEQVRALRGPRLSQKEIAQRLAIGVRTVQRRLGQNENEARCPRRKSPSIFDPYAPYVLTRWQQGERDIPLLWQELQEQGGYQAPYAPCIADVESTPSRVSPTCCAFSARSGFCRDLPYISSLARMRN